MTSLLSKISGLFFAPDIAIDLGTANTRLYAAGRGIIAESPSVVRISQQLKSGANSQYLKFHARQAKSDYVMPLRGGVVIDVAAAAQLLERLLRKMSCFNFSAPRVIVCAPSDVSEEEHAALIQANKRGGASAVAVVPEPLAAAIGSALDVSSPYAQMLVDIGEGVTDIAVIREGSLIKTAALRVAGNELHKAVQSMAREHYQIRLSKKAAELLIIKSGAVYRQILPDSLEFCGVTNFGRKIKVTIESREVSNAIRPVVNIIAAAISRTVWEISPELCAEVIETGICLTGGVALLPGIAEIIAEKTNLPVVLAPSPLHSVILGAGSMLDVSAKTNLWRI